MASEQYIEQLMQYVSQLIQRTAELRDAGRWREAVELGEETLRIARAALGQGHPFVPLSLNNLGTLYHDVGDYAAAERVTREALDMLRGGDGDPAVGTSLHNLAGMHHQTGDAETAERLFREALDILAAALGRDHPEVATTLNDLGALRDEMGDQTEAESLLREALQIRRARLGKRHRDVAQTLTNLAIVLNRKGDPAEAERLHLEALKIEQKQLGRRHPATAGSLINLAGLAFDRGDSAGAERLLREALDIRIQSLGEDHPTISSILEGIALTCVATGRAGEARDLMHRAARIDDREMGLVFSVGSEARSLSFLALLRRGLDRFLTLVLAEFPGDGEAVGAAFDLVLRRKGIWAEALAAQRDAVLGGRYPALAPRLRELAALKMQIAQATLEGAGPDGAGLRGEWAERREALERELAEAIPEIGLQQRLQEADRRAVAGALPPGSALVEMVKFDPFDFQAPRSAEGAQWRPARYVAFVLAAARPEDVRVVDLGEAEAIDRAVAVFRSATTGEGVGPTWQDAGHALRRMVFDPLVPHLAEGTRLFLSPDGDLTMLPFEVLPTEDGYLLGRHPVSYVSSGRDVLRFGASPAGPSPSVVAADPDFELTGEGPAAEEDGPGAPRSLDRAGLAFGRLVGTRDEGEAVAGLLDISPWVGEAVLEGRLKRHRSPFILHLATHGFFLPDQPGPPGDETGSLGQLGPLRGPGMENPLLRAGLALAGANTFLQRGPLPADAEDGILTAEDVTGLDLLGSELVVLSACETGLGEVTRGEGVYGLRRAFVLAGARSLVMSLWKVPDRPTSRLMRDFYARLLDGESKADALRGAQMEFPERYPEWSHPRMWGAFVLQGDPGPLTGRPPATRAEAIDAAPVEPEPADVEVMARSVRACGLAVIRLDDRHTALVGSELHPELVSMEVEGDEVAGALSVALPDPPGGYGRERALTNLLLMTEAASYLKAVLTGSGGLVLAAEVPAEVVTTQLAGALVRSLLIFHGMRAKDLIDEKGFNERLRACLGAQSGILSPEHARQVPEVLRGAGLPVEEHATSAFATAFEPGGPQVVVQLMQGGVHLYRSLPGAEPKGDRAAFLEGLLELNRAVRVAKATLSLKEGVNLQYQSPVLTPGVLAHAREQLAALADGVTALGA